MHGGQLLVRVFERAGIDYIFSSPGSEWPPVWDALAEISQKTNGNPKFINCRHEALAVAMAAGYTKVRSRPQVVVLHAAVGPLNAAMFLRATYQERVPMVVCAGESAAYGEDDRLADPGAQWLHSLSDLGGPADLLRRCVKWSERVSSSAILASSLERAIRIAEEPPPGPVLLSVPFEWMMEEVSLSDSHRSNEAVRAVEPEEKGIQQAIRLLTEAHNPVVVTEYLGRDIEAVGHLVELCELLGIPVIESHGAAFLNFPRTHPLYLHNHARIETADLVVIAEAVTPWYPAGKGPKLNARVLLVAEEFPNTRLPFWGYDVDLALIAKPAATLAKLIKGVRSAEHFAENRHIYRERFKQIQAEHELGKSNLRSEAEKHASETPIDPRWLCHVLDQCIPAEATIVQETTVYRTLIQNMIPRSEPMSYIARITGGLGVGLGYALGVKLAMENRPVFALLGDGAFHYNPVLACLGLSQEYALPIVIVLFNNQRYLSMERSLLKYFPEGSAKNTGIHYGSLISPNPEYSLLAQVYGGHGVRVTDPQEIQPAIEQALEHAAQGRLALIDVVLNNYTAR